MNCKLTLSLISESQEGNVGDDWKYDVVAKVFQDGLKGEGGISVPKHTLESGAVREPFGEPDPVVLFEGGQECLGLLRIEVGGQLEEGEQIP